MNAKEYPIGTTVTNGKKHFHLGLTYGGKPIWTGVDGVCAVLPDEYKVVYQPERTFKVGEVITKAEVEELPDGSAAQVTTPSFVDGHVILKSYGEVLCTGDFDIINETVEFRILSLPDTQWD